MRNKQSFYDELRVHLLNDDRPSAYLNEVSREAMFSEYPFSFLDRLKEVEQSPKHHPEGNVWNHTMLVVDEAARNREKSQHGEALMWAALLHDIGKAETTKNRKGRITSYHHEKVGAALAEKFFREFTVEEDLIREVVALIRWHMQILFVTRSMQFAEVKSMLAETDPEEIALLGFCDRMGRLNVNRQAEVENLKLFKEKLREQLHE